MYGGGEVRLLARKNWTGVDEENPGGTCSVQCLAFFFSVDVFVPGLHAAYFLRHAPLRLGSGFSSREMEPESLHHGAFKTMGNFLVTDPVFCFMVVMLDMWAYKQA